MPSHSWCSQKILDWRVYSCRPSIGEQVVLCVGKSGMLDQIFKVAVRTTSPALEFPVASTWFVIQYFSEVKKIIYLRHIHQQIVLSEGQCPEPPNQAEVQANWNKKKDMIDLKEVDSRIRKQTNWEICRTEPRVKLAYVVFLVYFDKVSHSNVS